MDQAPAYIYTPLPKADEDVRILLLRCHGRSQYDELVLLRQRERQEEGNLKDRYTALSYTWNEDPTLLESADVPSGSSERQNVLTLSGTYLPIRNNLAKAIKKLRLARCAIECGNDCRMCTRRMWIDSVCINQADPVERTLQVSIMGSIYADAEMCVAWVGEDSMERDGEAIMDVLGHFGKCADQQNFPGWGGFTGCTGCEVVRVSVVGEFVQAGANVQ